MKFVADENVPRQLVARLRADRHEILWITKTNRRLKDPPIIDLAWREAAIIITNDSDFQRHILEEKQPAYGVVWLRVGWMSRTQRNERAHEAIRAYQDRLLNHFTTIYPDRVEQEPLPEPRKRDVTEEGEVSHRSSEGLRQDRSPVGLFQARQRGYIHTWRA